MNYQNYFLNVKAHKMDFESKVIPSKINSNDEQETDFVYDNSDDNEENKEEFHVKESAKTSLFESNNENTTTIAIDEEKNETKLMNKEYRIKESVYCSSGYWNTIDKISSFGLSTTNPGMRLSKRLYKLRKRSANFTGLHGILSKKNVLEKSFSSEEHSLNEEALDKVRKRILAIESARERIESIREKELQQQDVKKNRWKNLLSRSRRATNRLRNKKEYITKLSVEYQSYDEEEVESDSSSEIKRRVIEIDELILKGQEELSKLQCEKDSLQRRPNPLFNYSSTQTTNATRILNFPPPTIVEEYIETLIKHGRLIKMNYKDLWSSNDNHIHATKEKDGFETNGINGAGSWLLRQTFGNKGTLGEKICEVTEIAAYKAVCSALMSLLARFISTLHGVNVMKHSDVRLYMDWYFPKGDTVHKEPTSLHNVTIDDVDASKKISRKKKKKKRKNSIQRDAIVETYLSHCQISVPLLKYFPFVWQRQFISNIITLITIIISDFADGIKIKILGYALTLQFEPITEQDIIDNIMNRKETSRERQADFEAAIVATAQDISTRLDFLDNWYERVLGSEILRAQIGNLISRIVLNIVDDSLQGSMFDLWSNQVDGPRITADLEYRVL